MKILLPLTALSVIFCASFIQTDKTIPQNKDKVPGAIPENIDAVIQKSCKPCHFQGGGFMPTFHVNFSKWDKYSPEKQAKKARQICSILLDNKMPPEEVRTKRPEKVPTKDQVSAICKWAESLKSEQ